MWLLGDRDSLPAWMAARAVPVALVALLPDEVAELERATSASGEIADVDVAALAAKGVTATEIAASLHISQRTAYRRLARLRDVMGARNAAELAARLNERGF